MRNYSGGLVYRTHVTLPAQAEGMTATLDLGAVVSTARVLVNGRDAGVRLSPPWTFEIGDFIKSGYNVIEVTVFNTAANHYLNVPTRYRGKINSGLLGPVSIHTCLLR